MSRRARSLILVLALLTFPGTLWRWLTGSFPSLVAVWEKEGSDMDPNGRTVPRPASSATTDAGVEMDPDG